MAELKVLVMGSVVDGTVTSNGPLRQFPINTAFWIILCQISWLLLYYKYVLKLRLIGLLQQCTAMNKMVAVHTTLIPWIPICNLIFQRWNWISKEKYEMMIWKFSKIHSMHEQELWKKNFRFSSNTAKLLVSILTPQQDFEVMTQNLVTYINICLQWHSYNMSIAHLFTAQLTISSNSRYYLKVVYVLSITH